MARPFSTTELTIAALAIYLGCTFVRREGKVLHFEMGADDVQPFVNEFQTGKLHLADGKAMAQAMLDLMEIMRFVEGGASAVHDDFHLDPAEDLNGTFITKASAFAASLICLGATLLEIRQSGFFDRRNNEICEFIFRDNPSIAPLLTQYTAKNLRVEPKRFTDASRELSRKVREFRATHEMKTREPRAQETKHDGATAFYERAQNKNGKWQDYRAR
jgi:hypothetical protein